MNDVYNLQQLLILIRDNIQKQKTFLEQLNIKELTKLQNPCHYPSIRYSLDELFSVVYKDNDQKILRSIADIMKKDFTFKLFSNRYTLFLVFSILVTRLTGDYETASIFNMTLVLQFYASLLYKYIRYCDKSKFTYTLNQLSHLHIFKAKGSIPNALDYLGKVILKKHYNGLTLKNSNSIVKYVLEIRHRINQSLKSFANLYYKLENIEISEDEGRMVASDINVLIDNVVEKFLQSFFIVEELDVDLIKKINSHFHVNINNIIAIFRELQDTIYYDDIKLILRKIFNINSIQTIKNDADWNNYIKSLLSTRNSRQETIREMLRRILEKLKSYQLHIANKNMTTKLRVENIIILYMVYMVKKYL